MSTGVRRVDIINVVQGLDVGICVLNTEYADTICQ